MHVLVPGTTHAKCQKVVPEVACRVDRITQGQSSNILWCYLHNGRITSSRFHDVFVRKMTTFSDKLVISLLGYCSHLTATHLPPQIEWGKTQEAVARQDYMKTMNK